MANRTFNVAADCKPGIHYMVNIQSKLDDIKDMIDKGQYFTINRARQYGKTTTLKALGRLLQKDYIVISLDFQMMSYSDFERESTFVEALSGEIISRIQESDISRECLEQIRAIAEGILEEDGRRYFLLYLRPIINGTGNYYIESGTRNMERTDVIVDYQGEQFVVELKIWRGNAYHTRGETQLSEYLDYYHLKKGYMLSFNFNKKKQIGVTEISLGDKILIEAVV